MQKRYVALAGLCAVLLLPASGEAQRQRHWHKPNPWSFAPYIGLMNDPLDISADGESTGWQLGFRLGYGLTDRARLTANIGYAESDDVAFSPPTVPHRVYDNQYIITTGGAEYDILPGNTSVSLGVEAGGLWREVSFDREVGAPPPGDSQESPFSFNFTVAPGLTVRHGFTPRTAFEVSVRDYILPEDRVEHMPSLTVGFRFR